MPIPDYQTLMLPLLRQIADQKIYIFKNVVDSLAKQFKLTDDELGELLPSGQSFLFPNRVGWARTYLKKANLIDSPKRGTIVITERGLSVLKENPIRLSSSYLTKFPEFVEFQLNKKDPNDAAPIASTQQEVDKRTPEETIETSYQDIRQSIAQELLETVIKLSPLSFERLVVELLVKMGYGGSIKDAGKAVGRTGDEGIDGTIKEDKLGLDVIYIQAKKWQTANVVGRPELHKFVGALAGQGAKKGIFITTSSFSKDAWEYIPRNETKIVLIDGNFLTQLMIDYNLGVSTQRIYEIKRIDADYFDSI